VRVLVTGGAGYIGSVVVEELLAQKHTPIVYDNLSKGHRQSVAPGAELVEGELVDQQRLERVLTKHEIEAVMHMAADSLVGESFRNPAKYYGNTVVAGLSLLEAMRSARVSRIVFSSTAAVYGEPERQPIRESDATLPTNPYGETKLAFERALHWYEQAYSFRHVSLRYFNAAGATTRCGELHDPETHLIPLILQVAVGRRPVLEIFGNDYSTRDGTCVRDYIHVSDLARAHVLALSVLSRKSEIFNLGCGGGYTVLEVIEAARRVTGRPIPIRIEPRRSGDPAVLIASSEKIQKEVGWYPRQQDLYAIIESAWSWMRMQT
jgi:UDP-glucose 4-epimerase